TWSSSSLSARGGGLLRRRAQSPADQLDQLRDVEGLQEHGYSALLHEPMLLGSAGGSREKDDALQRMQFPLGELPVEARAIQLGHVQIGDDEVVALALELLERLDAIGGGVDVVAFYAQHVDHQLGDQGIVVDDQNAWGRGRIVGWVVGIGHSLHLLPFKEENPPA